MQITFTHEGSFGHVDVTCGPNRNPAEVGALPGSADLAQCIATIEHPARGYRSLFGWVQLVKSTDNAFSGRRFEIDPFDPFALHDGAPTPYCWYGIVPTLFDAPSRDDRAKLHWEAHSFLAVSPRGGDTSRVVTALLGFSWGFDINEVGDVQVRQVARLTGDQWNEHTGYLGQSYPGWKFSLSDGDW